MLRLDRFERYPLAFGPTPIEHLDALILLHRANPAGSNFRKRQVGMYLVRSVGLT
jgi:1-aminocyclopropane-1-carboxylate deaminase/D-cysteine desulfhydrase-like pyridoxal-dependent ACC family enzyme